MPGARSAKKKSRAMSPDHKQALADGRAQGQAVRAYLDALERHKPRRGRKRTAASIESRLARIEDELVSADVLRRLELIQERMELQAELTRMSEVPEVTALEDAFVDAARHYGERKGITYAAWREAGVQAAVLKRAGITRGVA